MSDPSEKTKLSASTGGSPEPSSNLVSGEGTPSSLREDTLPASENSHAKEGVKEDSIPKAKSDSERIEQGENPTQSQNPPQEQNLTPKQNAQNSKTSDAQEEGKETGSLPSGFTLRLAGHVQVQAPQKQEIQMNEILVRSGVSLSAWDSVENVTFPPGTDGKLAVQVPLEQIPEKEIEKERAENADSRHKETQAETEQGTLKPETLKPETLKPETLKQNAEQGSSESETRKQEFLRQGTHQVTIPVQNQKDSLRPAAKETEEKAESFQSAESPAAGKAAETSQTMEAGKTEETVKDIPSSATSRNSEDTETAKGTEAVQTTQAAEVTDSLKYLQTSQTFQIFQNSDTAEVTEAGKDTETVKAETTKTAERAQAEKAEADVKAEAAETLKYSRVKPGKLTVESPFFQDPIFTKNIPVVGGPAPRFVNVSIQDKPRNPKRKDFKKLPETKAQTQESAKSKPETPTPVQPVKPEAQPVKPAVQPAVQPVKPEAQPVKPAVQPAVQPVKPAVKPEAQPVKPAVTARAESVSAPAKAKSPAVQKSEELPKSAVPQQPEADQEPILTAEVPETAVKPQNAPESTLSAKSTEAESAAEVETDEEMVSVIHPEDNWFICYLIRVGETVANWLYHIGDFAMFSARVFSWLPKLPRRGTLLPCMYEIGIMSLPVIVLTGTFIGMVLAVQSYHQLKGYYLETRMGALINLSLVRELGPVLAATMLAGRIGSSMAAELGTMKVTEQIDALGSMGVNPIHYLVVPRFLGCLLLIPILTIFADFMGIVGGAYFSVWIFNVDWHFYLTNSNKIVGEMDIFIGIFKSLFFGATIGLIGCHRGFNSRPGAQGVGRAATEAFVFSFVFILLLDLGLGTFFEAAEQFFFSQMPRRI